MKTYEEIEGTGVPAGWIKLSAGDDGMTECEEKVLRAAAYAAAASNAVIGSHTIRGRVVKDQVSLIEGAGCFSARTADGISPNPKRGWVWDFPVAVDPADHPRVGSDYYQNLMLWSLPAAIAGGDLAGPCRPGGLVDRILEAGRAG